MITPVRLHTMLVNWVQLSRWADWSTSKLPFLGATALILAPAETSAVQVLAIMGTVLCWAAFGYGLNDVADRVGDMRSGKRNRAADVSATTWASFLAANAAGSLWFCWLWARDLVAPALVVGGLAFACAYSVPPLRLKERGALGLLCGAVSQWVLPVLAISAVQREGWSHPATWCLALLGFAIGIRWMAVHQSQDAAADRRAGVRTYASLGGQMWPILLGAFLAEAVLLAVILVLGWPHSYPAMAALAFLIMLEALGSPMSEPMRKRLNGYDRAPLSVYYFLLLPLTLALSRALASPAFLAVAGVFTALGWCYVTMISGELHDTWKARARKA